MVLIDIREDVPQGVALDIFQTAPFFKIDIRVSGSNDPAAMQDVDVVVVAVRADIKLSSKLQDAG